MSSSPDILLVRHVRRRNAPNRNQNKFRRYLSSKHKDAYGELIMDFSAYQEDLLRMVDRFDQYAAAPQPPLTAVLDLFVDYYQLKQAYRCVANKFPYRVVTIDGLAPEEEELLYAAVCARQRGGVEWIPFYNAWLNLTK